MDDDLIIKVEGLYKKFCRSLKRSMLYGTADVSRNMLGISYDPGILRKAEFWSLQDINFELRKGGALGVIGQNGSGKTTLLRLINGIFPPDKGKITVRGKIGALIAVGAGFHPHMTGRENIYLNGTILGMTKEQIDQRFNDIIEFADIGDFMDAPVATYSSGMNVRLGFAIAIHSDPEILLADEILAVGDLSFALKCYRKIAEFREKGGSIILVSHSIQLVRNTCDQVIWIDKGIVKEYGETQKVCDDYETFMIQKDNTDARGYGTIINNDPKTRISNVEFIDAQGNQTNSFKTNDKFTARIYYDISRELKDPIFTFSVLNPENVNLISSYTNFDKAKLPKTIRGKGYLDLVLDSIPIKPGTYNLTVTLSEGDVNNLLDWHEKYYTFTILPDGNVAYGILRIKADWIYHKEIEMTLDKYVSQDIPIKDQLLKYFDKKDKLTIFDIGACEGEDSIRYSNLFPNSTIYSFEPLPSNFNSLTNNIKKFSKSNINASQLALSDTRGTSDFYVSAGEPKNLFNDEEWNWGNKSSSLLQPVEEMKEYYEWLEFKNVVKVNTTTLNLFCSEHKIDNIDFIHLDVQGAELLVLNGGQDLLPKIKMIYLEVEKVELYKGQGLAHDVEEFMNLHNFEKIKDTVNDVTGDQLYIRKDILKS